MIYPDYPGEIGLLFHQGEKGEYTWSARELSLYYHDCLLKSVGNYQTNPGRMTNGSEPRGMKVCVTGRTKTC